jgi:hypothetical protein
MFKPTIMLNAGTVHEALAQGYVNIVLHGHEHFRMYARYGTLYGQQSDAIVLGAGSITGMSDALPLTQSNYLLTGPSRSRKSSTPSTSAGVNGARLTLHTDPRRTRDPRALLSAHKTHFTADEQVNDLCRISSRPYCGYNCVAY